jgi:hypothetical protein
MILKLTLLIFSITHAEVSFNEFLDLKTALNKAFVELRPDENHRLSINQPVGDHENYWWDLDIVHASYSLLEDGNSFQHNIFLFGGFARLAEMTLDGLAITACHEIGHGLGGAPFKTNGKSQEGQADFYSTNICLPTLFKYLYDSSHHQTEASIIKLCEDSLDANFCYRAMKALESNIFFFEYLGYLTSFETRSQETATTLNYSDTYYPSAQCRLDTLVNGILNKKRPPCWFPKKL